MWEAQDNSPLSQVSRLRPEGKEGVSTQPEVFSAAKKESLLPVLSLITCL